MPRSRRDLLYEGPALDLHKRLLNQMFLGFVYVTKGVVQFLGEHHLKEQSSQSSKQLEQQRGSPFDKCLRSSAQLLQAPSEGKKLFSSLRSSASHLAGSRLLPLSSQPYHVVPSSRLSGATSRATSCRHEPPSLGGSLPQGFSWGNGRGSCSHWWWSFEW